MENSIEEDIAITKKLITTKFNNDYSIDNKDKEAIEHILTDYKRLQKENEELKEKENKIYKEVQESLSFEKFLIAKDREPDLFNQGRFYIQIMYDILNGVESPEGIHKENKYIRDIAYIPVQKVKEKIEELDISISACEYADDDSEEYKQEVEKNKAELLVAKKVLHQLLEKSEEKE